MSPDYRALLLRAISPDEYVRRLRALVDQRLEQTTTTATRTP